jgi:hypothetical protein
MLGAWEGFWRFRGFSPGLQDDWPIWAMVRRDVAGGDGETFVVAGASRIQVGFHPDVYQQATGGRAFILAIDGSSPIPVLADLAADAEFSGTVLCSIIPMFLAEPDDNGRAAKWVRKTRNQTLSSRLETPLRMVVQQTLAWRYTGLLPGELGPQIIEGSWPQPPYAPMRGDRYRPADFSRADLQKVRQGRIQRERELARRARPLARGPFLKRIERLNRLAVRIEKRGGRVIFIRYPSSGPVRELEEKTWPRSRYWDVFARRSCAVSIHFEDYDSLSGFKCPDGSHLDVTDARRFTRELIHIIDGIVGSSPT